MLNLSLEVPLPDFFLYIIFFFIFEFLSNQVRILFNSIKIFFYFKY